MSKTANNVVVNGLFLIILTMIVFFLNIIVSQFPPMRIDLTANGKYSLSDASKRVVERLEDRIKVEAYFTKELPAPYNQHATYLRDLLEEYAAYSNGNLAFEFIDPGTEDSIRQEMMMKGIPPVQIQEVKNDEFGIKQAFMGIVLTYGTKKETVPVVRQTDSLEYELTRIIKKLTSQELKTVAFSAGHGEPKMEEKMTRVKGELEKNYKLITHDFSTAKAIPEEVVTLVIVGPMEKWTDEQLYYVDQFIMRGGTVAFLLDSVSVDFQQLQAKDIDHGMFDLLAHYGVTIEKNLVLDPQCKRINVATQQGMFRVQNIVNYPYFPAITDLDREHILTMELEVLSFPFMSSLSVAQSTDRLTYSVLAKTTDRSWAEKGTYMINPMERKDRPDNAVAGPFNAVAVVTGSFDSFYADKATQGGVEYIPDPSQVLTQSPETRMLVIGDASIPQDEFAEPNNMIFFVNSIDWLAQDNDLIKIRNRGLVDKPLDELEAGTKSLIRYANMLGIPILFILFGIVRWQWRKARLRKFQLGA